MTKQYYILDLESGTPVFWEYPNKDDESNVTFRVYNIIKTPQISDNLELLEYLIYRLVSIVNGEDYFPKDSSITYEYKTSGDWSNTKITREAFEIVEYVGELECITPSLT